jgi:NADPH2:quinone reductase
MRAVQCAEFGEPEVLRVVELPIPEPAENELLIRVAAAGVNFTDVHRRNGTHLSPTRLPAVFGVEVTGERADTGERVLAFVGSGGYAEYAVARPEMVYPLPRDVPDAIGLALCTQGLTALETLRRSAFLRSGESVAIHAAAGGVGSLAVQVARALGAGRIIGTASTEAKRTSVSELGADVAIDGASAGLTGRLLEANRGDPIDVILEMVGGATFTQSLLALAPFGRLVTYGIASGTDCTLRSGELMTSSRGVLGFWMSDLIRRRDWVLQGLGDLFGMHGDGRLRVIVGGTFPLAEAGRAHAEVEGRRTVGKVILDVRT